MAGNVGLGTQFPAWENLNSASWLTALHLNPDQFWWFGGLSIVVLPLILFSQILGITLFENLDFFHGSHYFVLTSFLMQSKDHYLIILLSLTHMIPGSRHIEGDG